MTVTLLEGHVTDVLASQPANHWHVCVTSPPYWLLRAYGSEPQVWQTADGDALCAPEQHEWAGAGKSGTRLRNGQGTTTPGFLGGKGDPELLNPQMGAFCARCGAWRGELGQEPTPELYVEHLVAVFRSVRRVLRPDGTLWVNLSGSYYTEQPGGQNGTTGTISAKAIEANRQQGRWRKPAHPIYRGLDWVDVPGLFAQAMQRDGWTWRSDVVWVKPSALPESVSGTRWERCRVRPPRPPSKQATHRTNPAHIQGDSLRVLSLRGAATEEETQAAFGAEDCPGCPKCAATEGLVLRRGSGRPTKTHEHVLLFTRGPGYFFDTEAVREPASLDSHGGGRPGQQAEHTALLGVGHRNGVDGSTLTRPGGAGGRNLRDVWTISPEPISDAHYAAYPSALPERCIKAGTSEWGCCPACGAPWARVIDRSSTPAGIFGIPGKWHLRDAETAEAFSAEHVDAPTVATLGWRPTCATKCPGYDQPPTPARVLDPFSGSGTTLLAANRLGRDATGVELKPAYNDLARKRVGREPLSLFAWQGQEAMAPVGEEPPALGTTKQEQHPTRTVRGFNQRWKASHGAGGLEDTPEEVQV